MRGFPLGRCDVLEVDRVAFAQRDVLNVSESLTLKWLILLCKAHHDFF